MALPGGLYSSLHQGQTATVVFERNGEKQTVVLTPKQSDTGAYLYGFSRTVQREKGGALETVGYSCAEIRYWLKATVESLKMLIGGQVGLEEMSGPVGIVSTIGDTYKESRVDGWYYVTMNMIMIFICLSTRRRKNAGCPCFSIQEISVRAMPIRFTDVPF